MQYSPEWKSLEQKLLVSIK